jgi:crotonobetainyl-CoA:carnitine CoA-transferase CaiB-like acyl-CoA transferase
MGWIREIELPTGKFTRTFASPLRIDGKPAPIRRGPPALDADRAAILQELSRLEAAAKVVAS